MAGTGKDTIGLSGDAGVLGGGAVGLERELLASLSPDWMIGNLDAASVMAGGAVGSPMHVAGAAAWMPSDWGYGEPTTAGFAHGAVLTLSDRTTISLVAAALPDRLT